MSLNALGLQGSDLHDRSRQGQRQKSRGTQDPSSAPSLAQSYRLLMLCLLRNKVPTALQASSKGALLEVSTKDQWCPHLCQGPSAMTSLGPGGGARLLQFLNGSQPISGASLLQLRDRLTHYFICAQRLKVQRDMPDHVTQVESESTQRLDLINIVLLLFSDRETEA